MSNNLIIPDFDRNNDKALKVFLEKNKDFEGVLNVTLFGRLDTYNTAFFQEKVELICKSEYKKILFKCAGLDYISSSGLGVFASYFPKFKEKQGTFVFSDIQPRVFEVFQLLGFNRLFSISSDSTDLSRLFDDKMLKNSEIFPKSFNCPNCSSKLKAPKAGRFRCSHCKIVISVNSEGKVTL